MMNDKKKRGMKRDSNGGVQKKDCLDQTHILV